MIDIKDLLINITPQKVIELVKELGCDDYIEKEDCIIFKTICHHLDQNDANHKLYYYKNSKLFVCYSHCGTFNIIDLFKKRYELEHREYNFYMDIILKIADGGTVKTFSKYEFDTKYKSIYSYQEKDNNINIPIITENLLNPFIVNYTDEWLREGIDKDTMDLYNIKYSISQNKIIIPHYNENNELIGIRGRSLNEEDIAIGKYMPVQIEGKIYKHPLAYNLYGLNITKDNIKRIKTAIIFEGEKSCLLYNSFFGKENNISVAVCGSTLHKYQIDLLIKSGADNIVIAFDKEGDNWSDKEKYYAKLKSLCQRYIKYCNIGFIYDTQNILDLKDSPIDKGKENFIKLYKNLTWIK